MKTKFNEIETLIIRAQELVVISKTHGPQTETFQEALRALDSALGDCGEAAPDSVEVNFKRVCEHFSAVYMQTGFGG